MSKRSYVQGLYGFPSKPRVEGPTYLLLNRKGLIFRVLPDRTRVAIDCVTGSKGYGPNRREALRALEAGHSLGAEQSKALIRLFIEG